MQKLLGSRDALKHRIHDHIQKQTLALQEADSKVGRCYWQPLTSKAVNACAQAIVALKLQQHTVSSNAAKAAVRQKGASTEIQPACGGAEGKFETGPGSEGTSFTLPTKLSSCTHPCTPF